MEQRRDPTGNSEPQPVDLKPYQELKRMGEPERLRRYCYQSEYNRGIKMARSGAIRHIEMEPDMVWAIVQESDESYPCKVEIYGDDWDTIECGCSESSYFPYTTCEHSIAVLSYIHNDIRMAVARTQRRHDVIDKILATTPPQKIIESIASMMKGDHDTYMDFLEQLGLKDVTALPDPVRLLEYMYSEDRNRGPIRQKIDLDEVFDIAGTLRDAGEHAAATEAYMALVSSISDNMSRIKDEDGFYADCLAEAIQQTAESVVREKPDAHAMNEYASHMLDRCAKSDENVSRWYADALQVMCDRPDSLGILESRVDVMIQEEHKPHVIAALARIKTYILEEAERDAEVVKFLAEAHRVDEGLAIKYVAMLHGENHRDAVQGCKNAMLSFPDSVEIARASMEIFDKSDPEYLSTACKLFQKTQEWTHLDMAKEVAAHWPEQLHIISQSMGATNPELVIKMYIREKMYEDAIDMVEAADQLDIYRAFARRLAKRRRTEYFAAYSKKILEFAASRTGQKHYDDIKEHLTHVKKMSGFEAEFDNIMQSIRSMHWRRSLLLETIKDL